MKKLIYDSDLPDDFLTTTGGNLCTLVDGDSRNIKKASSSVVSREMLEACKPDKDHFLIHLVALGDAERYGPNRNADAFSKKACEERHDTFVTNGSFYREHRHHNKEESIGIVKASAYNEEMGRIELAIWGNKKKASEEWDLAKEGKPLSFSMSCSVKYDVCNACGHKAKSDNDRCEHIKYARNQYIDGHKKYAFMWNPDPVFFDISRVKKPADRIAHHIFIDANMQKAASEAGLPLRSSDYKRVGGVYIPGDTEILGCLSPDKLNTLKKLASASKKLRDVITNNINTSDPEVMFINNVATYARIPESVFPDEQLEKLASLRPDTFFYELNKRACVLPFSDFMAYCLSLTKSEVLNSNVYKYAMKKTIPVVMEDMEESEADEELEEAFEPSSRATADIDPANNDEVQSIMDKAKEFFSVEPQQVKTRAIRISIVKFASYEDFDCKKISESEVESANRLSRAYGYYKVAAVNALKNNIAVDQKVLDFLVL